MVLMEHISISNIIELIAILKRIRALENRWNGALQYRLSITHTHTANELLWNCLVSWIVKPTKWRRPGPKKKKKKFNQVNWIFEIDAAVSKTNKMADIVASDTMNWTQRFLFIAFWVSASGKFDWNESKSNGQSGNPIDPVLFSLSSPFANEFADP